MKKSLITLLFFAVTAAASSQVLKNHNSGKSPISQKAVVAKRNPEVWLYENPNYDGRFQIVTLQTSGTKGFAMNDFNDMVSSVQVPKGMVAIVYEHSSANGGYGNYVTLMEDCPDLSVYNLNDKISHVEFFSATRPGYVYVRPKMVNNQVVDGHWERAKADGSLPDNSGPAIVQNMEASGVDESLAVFRIQLRIITGNQAFEAMDKEVCLKLNEFDDPYFLDYGPDDFEKGADKKYDIISSRIKRISDIQFIEINEKGDDVWGIKAVELYINNSNVPIFSKTYPKAFHINGAGNYPRKIYFTKDELRKDYHWKNIATDVNIKKPSPLIKAETIKSMVESMVGNMLHHTGNKLYWGNTSGANTVWADHVEMKRKDGNTLNFNLDLEAEITGVNPSIDVDFDLVFECTSSGFITVKTANVKTSCTIPTPVVQPSCETVRTFINGFLRWFGLDRFEIDDFSTNANTFNAAFVLGSENFKCKGVQVTPKNDVFIY